MKLSIHRKNFMFQREFILVLNLFLKWKMGMEMKNINKEMPTNVAPFDDYSIGSIQCFWAIKSNAITIAFPVQFFINKSISNYISSNNRNYRQTFEWNSSSNTWHISNSLVSVLQVLRCCNYKYARNECSSSTFASKWIS